MNESVLIGESGVQANGQAHGEIERMTGDLVREMNGTVSRTAVEQMLVALFASYEDAPIQLFVPIFVRRRAQDLLRGQAS